MRRGEVKHLLHHLNDVRPTIKITMELKKHGSFPFLDTKLTQREEGTLDVDVYRKQTYMSRYLHFNSHHPISAKRAAVGSLFDRARNVTLRKENLWKQEEHLTATFKQNGYSLPFIRSISTFTQKKSTPPPEEEPGEPGHHEEEEKQPLGSHPICKWCE